MDNKFNIIQFLKSAVATGASDEHLQIGANPFIRKNGQILKTNMPPLSCEDVDLAVKEVAPVTLRESILNKCDVDFMFEIKGCSRFRINYNRQLGLSALVIRNIPYYIPSLNELNLPDTLTNSVNFQNGIIIVTGPTGSGKSTTIASLINQMCLTYAKHLITIEDPVEYVYASSKSVISQRQIGVDTPTFLDGVKYALRQDPDIIFIGEIRDKETMEAALKAAETGHLVLTTLHTNDAVQTINRIINMFEPSNRDIIRRQLAETLRATIAQKLVYSSALQKRVPVCELLFVTSTVKDYILKDNLDEIYELLNTNNYDEMISMDDAIMTLVEKKILNEEEALNAAEDKNEFEKKLRGVFRGTKGYYDEQ